MDIMGFKIKIKRWIDGILEEKQYYHEHLHEAHKLAESIDAEVKIYDEQTGQLIHHKQASEQESYA